MKENYTPKPQFSHSGNEKKEFVEKMFDDISNKYDFLNHFLSFGIDIYWRNKFINKLNIKNGSTVLDVACGTGDIGFNILKNNKINLINIDISKNMLSIAKKKACKKNINNIQFIHGDAEKLPIDDNSIDFLTISYGFRNTSNHKIALSEFHRVLKPGGTLGILEFSIPKSKIMGKLFKFYFHKILPKIASLFSQKNAYKYLPESVDFFPSRKKIYNLINKAGFKNVNFFDLTFGISTIFLGKKNDTK